MLSRSAAESESVKISFNREVIVLFSLEHTSILTFKVNWLFTKRHLYISFAEGIVVFLCSTWLLKSFGESKVSMVHCLLCGGYPGGNPHLCSVHEEAGTD